jgi:hypothetical protein
MMNILPDIALMCLFRQLSVIDTIACQLLRFTVNSLEHGLYHITYL